MLVNLLFKRCFRLISGVFPLTNGDFYEILRVNIYFNIDQLTRVLKHTLRVGCNVEYVLVDSFI